MDYMTLDNIPIDTIIEKSKRLMIDTHNYIIIIFNTFTYTSLNRYVICIYFISFIFYNNFFSIPLIFLLMFAKGEMQTVMQEPALRNFDFQAAVLFNGFLGFAIRSVCGWNT